MSEDKPKLVIVGGDNDQDTLNAEAEVETPQEPEKTPAVLTSAVKVIHPLFQDQQTGEPLPPPPEHELRVGLQVSITSKGRVVTETPALFFASGDDPEEVADMIRDVILEGLMVVKEQNATVKLAPESALKVLDRFGEET